MKRIGVIAIYFCAALTFGGEQGEQVVPQPAVPKLPHVPRAWLGLDVSKPDQSITAHLPDLPPGMGFVIRSIDKDGPAETAGLKEFDVLWKFGDQMLVNESQLATLLRLRKPGDEVVLTGFRAGKPLEVKLKLGDAPDTKRLFPGDLVEEAVMPGECRGPMRVIRMSDKTATYTKDDEGTMELRREGEVYKVRIQDPKGELVFEGDIPQSGSLEAVPENWQRRVHALRRGLDHALDGRMMPVRQPRPRVIPVPEPKS